MCAMHISSVTGLEHYEAGIIASKCEQLSAKTETRAGRTLRCAYVEELQNLTILFLYLCHANL